MVFEFIVKRVLQSLDSFNKFNESPVVLLMLFLTCSMKYIRSYTKSHFGLLIEDFLFSVSVGLSFAYPVMVLLSMVVRAYNFQRNSGLSIEENLPARKSSLFCTLFFLCSCFVLISVSIVKVFYYLYNLSPSSTKKMYVATIMVLMFYLLVMSIREPRLLKEKEGVLGRIAFPCISAIMGTVFLLEQCFGVNLALFSLILCAVGLAVLYSFGLKRRNIPNNEGFESACNSLRGLSRYLFAPVIITIAIMMRPEKVFNYSIRAAPQNLE